MDLETNMKLFTTTPIHDKPYGATPVEVMTMIDMFQHWNEHIDEQVKIGYTPDGSDVYLFVNPNQREWSSMRDASYLLVQTPNGSMQPLMIS